MQEFIWKLFAITYAAFQIDWWFVTYNHLEEEGDEIVQIAAILSELWRTALLPANCTAAGIDEETRVAFMAWLGELNRDEWNTDRLTAMDMLYTPEQAREVEIVFE